MKRGYMIAAALAVLLAGGAGGIVFIRPPAIFGNGEVKADHPAGMSHTANISEATESKKQLLALVEQLGRVQDRIISGERGGFEEQGHLLTQIAGVIRQFSDDDWNDYANLRASFVYVLSGGDAQVLKLVAKNQAMSESDQHLVRGIISFALGQTRSARRLLRDIDPRSLDVSLIGPFALAQASLYRDEDHVKAIDLLDEARLIEPHTAIEEAAVRREVPLLVDEGSTERAFMLMGDYARRYGKSLYAHKLFRDFAESTAKRGELDDPALAEDLGGAFASTDGQIAGDFFVALAGEALLRGRLKLAKAAAVEVLNRNDGSAENLDKAKLYSAAAEAPSMRAGSALKALDQIAADRLSDDDGEIREVAGYIARVVTSTEPVGPDTPGTVRRNGALVVEDKAANEGLASAISAADAALKEADLTISGSVP